MGHGGPAREGKAIDLDAARAARVATTLQALTAPSRLMILATLSAGPRTVGEIVEAIGMEQPAVSHQLRLLRHLGFVVGTRHGRHVEYALHDDHVASLIEQALSHADHLDAELRVGSDEDDLRSGSTPDGVQGPQPCSTRRSSRRG